MLHWGGLGEAPQWMQTIKLGRLLKHSLPGDFCAVRGRYCTLMVPATTRLDIADELPRYTV